MKAGVERGFVMRGNCLGRAGLIPFAPVGGGKRGSVGDGNVECLFVGIRYRVY